MNFADLFRHETDLLELNTGQTLFQESEEMNGLMYVLMSGTAKVFVKGRLVEMAEAGAILGEMAMLDEGVRTATVIAKTDCKLVALDQRRFDFLIQNTPNFAQSVMRVIANRLRKTDVML